MKNIFNKIFPKTQPKKYGLADVWRLTHLDRMRRTRPMFFFRKGVTGWTVITDSQYEGKSWGVVEHDTETPLGLSQSELETSKAEFEVKAQERYLYTTEERNMYGGRPLHDMQPQPEELGEEQEQQKEFIGSLKFFGELNLELSNPLYTQSGFACLLSPKFRPNLDLDPYHGFEIRLRSDGRKYVMQVKVAEGLQEHLYQTVVPVIPPDTWTTIVIPFNNFFLTFRSFVEETHSPMTTDEIEHIGFMMAERHSGPFRLNIDWIRASKLTNKGVPVGKRYTGFDEKPRANSW